MAIEGRYFSWMMAAGENLDDLTPWKGNLFRAINAKGRPANNGQEACGLLVFAGRAWERVSLGYAGIMKFAAGADIAAGQPVTVGKGGYIFPATPGTHVVGRCLDCAVAQGHIGTGMFNFAVTAYVP